jgi:cytochrome c-type biogenesis protein CcmH
MLFWAIAAVLLALAVAAVVYPLLRSGSALTARDRFDMAVYRQQLAELERDLERGTIDAEQAEAARTEISRRLLAAADRAEAAERSGDRPQPANLAATIVAFCLPMGALGLYLGLGAPNQPDQPLAEARRAASPQASQQPNQQAGAPTGAPAGQAGPLDEQVERLRERLLQNPEDLQGWVLLARGLQELGRHDDAVRAYDHALLLNPDNATLLSAKGEAIVLAAQGSVTPDARETFDAALAADAGDPRARYYLALGEAQAGRIRDALDAWVALAEDAPPQAPWLPAVRQRIVAVAGDLGIDPDSVLPETAAAPPRAPAMAGGGGQPGPTQEDVAAAAEMSAGDRDAMIRGMVQRLADRLEEDPADLAGWVRLARAYSVLGEAEKETDALRRASEQAPEDVEILTLYARKLRGADGAASDAASVDRRILDLDPDNGEALASLANHAAATGDRQAAAGYLRRLLAVMPADAPQRDAVQQRLDALTAAQ